MSGLRVLVLDEEESLLASTASILESDGYRVTALRPGPDGDARLRERSDDVVLLDLQMSGVYRLTLLKAVAEGPRVIVMVDRSPVESRLGALSAGAWDFLERPFSATELRSVMRRAGQRVSSAVSPGPAVTTVPRV